MPFTPGAHRQRSLHPSAGRVGGRLPDGAPPDGRPPHLPFSALQEIAAGLAWVARAVPLGPDDDPAAPRSVRLLATASYDVWLITWPPGSGLGLHDHGGASSVLQVVEGELLETFTDQVARRALRARMLRRGDSAQAGASSVHDLRNVADTAVTTLHVYSPPLAGVTFFDHRSAGRRPQRTAAVAARAAQASSHDAVPPHAPALSLVGR